MSNFFQSFDQIGKEFKFNYNGSQFRTSEGGILTIIIAIGYVVLTWYFGQDIYLRVSPKFIKIDKVLDEFPRIQFNNSINFFGFGLFNPFNN